MMNRRRVKALTREIQAQVHAKPVVRVYDDDGAFYDGLPWHPSATILTQDELSRLASDTGVIVLIVKSD